MIEKNLRELGYLDVLEGFVTNRPELVTALTISERILLGLNTLASAFILSRILVHIGKINNNKTIYLFLILDLCKV